LCGVDKEKRKALLVTERHTTTEGVLSLRIVVAAHRDSGGCACRAGCDNASEECTEEGQAAMWVLLHERHYQIMVPSQRMQLLKVQGIPQPLCHTEFVVCFFELMAHLAHPATVHRSLTIAMYTIVAWQSIGLCVVPMHRGRCLRRRKPQCRVARVEA